MNKNDIKKLLPKSGNKVNEVLDKTCTVVDKCILKSNGKCFYNGTCFLQFNFKGAK